MHTDATGHGIIQTILDTLVSFDSHYSTSNWPALSALFRKTAQRYNKLTPHIADKHLADVISDVAKGCEQMAEQLGNGAGLKEANKFARDTVHKLLHTMVEISKNN